MQKKKLRNTLFKTNAELVAKIKQNSSEEDTFYIN